MKKSLWIGIVSFFVIALLTYGVLANSHIDIFSGDTYIYDSTSDTHYYAGKEAISLLDHGYGYSPYYDYEELNAFGYITLALVLTLFPGLIAALITRFATRWD